jgi:hypothetical protein
MLATITTPSATTSHTSDVVDRTPVAAREAAPPPAHREPARRDDPLVWLDPVDCI